jgi:hypothetical protein
MPVEAGIQYVDAELKHKLDPRFRGDDRARIPELKLPVHDT